MPKMLKRMRLLSQPLALHVGTSLPTDLNNIGPVSALSQRPQRQPAKTPFKQSMHGPKPCMQLQPVLLRFLPSSKGGQSVAPPPLFTLWLQSPQRLRQLHCLSPLPLKKW